MKHLFIRILYFLPILAFSQTIKGTFSPASDFTYAFLYEAHPDGADYIDRGKVNENGTFEITLDSTATPGIYKIVYATPPELNNFDIIFDGKEDIEFKFNQTDGVEFISSEENKLWASYLKSITMVNQTISNYYATDGKSESGFTSVFKVLKDTQKAYEESAKGKLAATFISSNKTYMPDSYEDLNTYSKNLKEHYFKTIDFNNYLLQSSSFLTDRVLNYVFNVGSNPNFNTYKTLVDEVAKNITNEELGIKTLLLQTVWQKFADLNNHEAANYIADMYLLNLAKESNNKVLTETLIAYKNTSLGTIAPDFEISSTKNTTSLHALTGNEQYVLIFWSSTCGHCLNELPKVKALLSDKDNVQVVAFGLESDAYKWSQEIKNYPKFIHTIGLDKWENGIVKTYGISATPTYFILDKDKKIVAKPYDYEQLKIYFK